MQAITVKFLPATNNRPARLKATANAGSVTLSYHNIDADDKYLAAATALCEQYGWDRRYDLINGTLTDGSEVYVLVHKAR